MADESLEGKVLVVTGGTSGIGREIVKQAICSGGKVFFTYNKNGDKAKEIYGETGAVPLAFALGNQQMTIQFLGNLVGGLAIDYFIANAGMEFSGDLTKHSFDIIHDNVNANLIGNLYLLQSIITGNFMSHGGQIAVIGSIAADGNHDQLAYSAAKSGLRGAVESLNRYDKQVREQELGIKLLEPAFVRTPMTEKILKILERRVIKARGGDELVDRFHGEGLVMDAGYAAAEIIKLTLDKSVTGVRTIPKGINLHKIREIYF